MPIQQFREEQVLVTEEDLEMTQCTPRMVLPADPTLDSTEQSLCRISTVHVPNVQAHTKQLFQNCQTTATRSIYSFALSSFIYRLIRYAPTLFMLQHRFPILYSYLENVQSYEHVRLQGCEMGIFGRRDMYYYYDRL